MGIIKKIFVLSGVVIILCLGAASQALASGCDSSPEAAVRCFVRNAVHAGLASPPPGMSMAQFRSYGVSVANIVQTPNTAVFLMGAVAAVSDAMPPANADGTANQAAQDAAVDAIVDAALQDGLLVLPEGTTEDQLKQFARSVAGSVDSYSGVNLSAGMLLRFLDAYLAGATASDGSVDWDSLQGKIASFVDGLNQNGLLRLPAGTSAEDVAQFAVDVAGAIQKYKSATGRNKL
jgi:hypothetical protein